MARRPRGQLRRDILDTVIELLIDTGDVDSVSIDAVVDRVGCTPPALYYYFPTKAELLRQACLAEFQRLADHIESEVAQVNAGTLTELVRRGYGMLHWAAEHRALYRILFMGAGDPGVVDGANLDADPTLRAVVGNIDSAIEQGLIRPLDPQVLQLALWGMVHGFASLAVSFPVIPVERLDAAMAVAVDAIGESVLTEPGRALWAQGRAENWGLAVGVG